MSSTEQDLSYLRDIVRNHSAMVLDPSRDHLFETKLYHLMRSENLGTLGQLVQSLRMRSSPHMERSIAEAMTINETSFFRDLRPFCLMESELLPRLIANRRRERHLRFWSAACSSGQEAYSLAMLLLDKFPELTTWRVEIVGTDLSAEMVERANAGKYLRIEVNRGLPARYLLSYFDKGEDDWTIKPHVRRLCSFQQRNLCAAPWLFERYDGILLRNVLFYFSDETRRRLLTRVHQMLAPDGFLFLGASEQASLPELWKPVLSDRACYHVPVPQR
ncbi:CheR family methyltransferase [Acidipila rosea]|uniref:Chemotaxis protein methyltransferase CheR n=1 Tax=Acidipila rosea TaxID=768535 RepID=A0A4R1KZ75_9BACT|nr:protein-glutamate O-methyltransferase CheR [Acidipila rosea]TCK70794.1 chemotaxis protein methyltransferase CheR [Acidipila rosea]